VAVCTYHLTFFQFSQYGFPVPVAQSSADVKRLVAEVVKLQDHHIALPAVDTGVLLQVVDQPGNPFADDPIAAASSIVDVPLSVLLVVFPAVVGSTGAAVDVLCREVRQRLLLPAS
jgi:hypothetical protein